MQEWPEGPVADQDAARERYTSDVRETRRALHAWFGAELPVAHLGLAVVLIASAVVAAAASPLAGALVAAAFAALFLAALAVVLLRGIRGRDALRRSYLFTFGWANFL